MSTEIKFRVWHKGLQDWYFDGVDAFQEDGTDSGEYYLANITEGGSEYMLVFMLASGLKDRNDKELYFDSDLVKLEDQDGLWYATRDDFGIPAWIPVDGGFGVHITFESYFLNGTRNKKAFEIMGNRFENPELIEA